MRTRQQPTHVPISDCPAWNQPNPFYRVNTSPYLTCWDLLSSFFVSWVSPSVLYTLGAQPWDTKRARQTCNEFVRSFRVCIRSNNRSNKTCRLQLVTIDVTGRIGCNVFWLKEILECAQHCLTIYCAFCNPSNRVGTYALLPASCTGG